MKGVPKHPKPAERRLSEKVSLKFTPGALARMEEAAKRVGIKRLEFCRRAIDVAVREALGT